jgi:hypothetical protein
MARLQRLRNLLHRVLRRKPMAPPQAPPADPYAERLVPVRKGPKGRSGAAVADPDESV